MPSSSGIRAGRAFIEFFVKDETRTQIEGIEKRLKSFGSSVKSFGGKLAGVSAALGTPLAAAVKIFAGFDDQMRVVKAVTGATTVQFSAMREEAKRLGATTSFTASQVAGAMTELGRAGFRPTQILDTTESVLALARATDTELPRAAEIAGAALRGFELPVDQMGRVTDVLTATANGSAQSLEDLFEAFKPVAPIAAEAGDSIESTAAAIGILANNGIKGSLAGSALARAYKNLSTGKTQKVLRGIGVEAVDSGGNLRALSDIIKDLANATNDKGTGDRLALFEELFGRGQAAALKLAKSGATFDEFVDTIKNSTGVAKESAEAMDKGIGGSFRKLLSAIEGVAIQAGEALDGPVGELADGITNMAGGVNKFVKENEGLVVTLGKVIIGMGALGVTMIAVGSAMSLTGSAIGAIPAIASAASTAVKGMNIAFAFLAANPAIIVIAGLVATFALLPAVISKVTRHTAQLSSEMSNLRKKGDELRQNDQLRIQRLEQLAEKQELSNDEQEEARSLISQLETGYGDLGITLDSATGKIEGLTTAQERLNEAMRRAVVAQLNQEISEARNNLSELAQEQKSIANSSISGSEVAKRAFRTANPLARLFLDESSESGLASEIDGITKKFDEQQKKIAELNRRRDALLAGDDSAITGNPKGDSLSGRVAAGDRESAEAKAAALKARQDAADAEKRLADLEEQEAAKRRTRLQQEIKDIQDVGEERKKLLKAIIAGEKAKEGGGDASRIAELEARLAVVDGNTEANVSGAIQKDEDEKRNRIATDEKSLQDEIARLRIQATKDGIEEEKALLDLERKQAIEDAQKRGLNIDLVNEKFDLLAERLAGAQDGLQRSFSLGTFNVSNLQSLEVGVGDDMKRAADAAEDNAEATDGVRKEVKKLREQSGNGNSFT